jgi:hypothetical protein
MHVHRFFITLFSAGLVVFCSTYFLIQRRFDVVTISGASVYAIGIIASVIGYSIGRKKRKGQDLIDSLPQD